jgi:hypothetical protein
MGFYEAPQLLKYVMQVGYENFSPICIFQRSLGFLIPIAWRLPGGSYWRREFNI